MTHMASDARQSHFRNRTEHWNRLHKKGGRATGWYYHRWLKHVYRGLAPPGHRVLEVGCGQGDLLAALRPSHGLGIDFSPYAVEAARTRHPHLRFELADAAELHIP
jgi:ubiquinone/menaquinone biosynthesis C-methylase UbiE